jgi:hypothetical protein
MRKRLSLFFFIFFLAICSCKKDTPAGYPSVQISAPYSLAVFNVPCTIQVTGHASDSKSLTSVTVYIANGQNIALESPIQIPVTSNSMNVSCSYQLNDIHLPSGQYYMTITASNGTNVSSAFQPIYIDAVPTKRVAIYAITRDATGVHAWGIDSVFKISPAFSYTVSGDYSSSDVNSYYQQLYIAGHDSGNVNVYSVPMPSRDWAISGVPSTTPYFTNVYCNNDAEFVSYYANNLANGYVKCYNHLGALQSVFNATTGYYPVKTYAWENFLFTEEKGISLSASEWLHIFYQSTSASYNQTSLPGPITAMYGYDNNDIFIFGNTGSGDGFIKLYNIPGNTFYSPPFSLNTYGKLLSAAQINANTYLLGFSNGTIYQYTYNPVSIIPYINVIIASTIRYDSINNQVIIASGKTVNAYNYGIGSATLAASITISDSVRDLRILYNK